MATQANFAATPHVSSNTVSVANTSTTGASGTFATIFTAGSNGSRLDSVKIKGIVAEGTTQGADSVRLWLYNGTNYFFLTEQLIPAGSGNVSATVANVDYTLALGIPLANGWSLAASTHLGSTTASYNVTAFGGDF